MPVVAVIDDYYPSHLTEGIKPMAFVVGPSSGNSDFLIAVNPDKEKEDHRISEENRERNI